MRVQGLGFTVWGLRFRLRVWGLGFRVDDLGFGVRGLGFRVWSPRSTHESLLLVATHGAGHNRSKGTVPFRNNRIKGYHSNRSEGWSRPAPQSPGRGNGSHQWTDTNIRSGKYFESVSAVFCLPDSERKTDFPGLGW